MDWTKCDAECPAKASNHYVLTNGLDLWLCGHHARAATTGPNSIERHVIMHHVEIDLADKTPTPTPSNVYRR